MDELQFPLNTGVKKSYWRAYYLSVRRWAICAGINVVDCTNDRVWAGVPRNVYSCVLNGKQFLMDFSDHKDFQQNPDDYACPYFKWHYSYDVAKHLNSSNVHPLSVLQDYDWDFFQAVRKRVTYTAQSNTITNNQRVRAGAIQRRRHVQNILVKRYGLDVSKDYVDQLRWWESHSDCLVAVHVPGARNDMLDRGQMELMGLGVCVVSPVIVTVLAGDRTLEPYKHFVPVEGTYNNLIDVIEWCRNNRSECVEIGKNAKLLYDKVVTPQKYWTYIKGVLDAK